MLVFLVAGAILMVFIAVYTYWRVGKLISFYGGDITRRSSRVLRLAAGGVIGVLCFNVWSTSAVILLHLLAAFIVLDIAAVVIRRLFKNQKDKKGYLALRKIYGSGVLPVCFLLGILVSGYSNMSQLTITEYQVTSDKVSGDYKVVLMTDIHYDTIQSPDILQNKIEEINAQNADLVLLGGDIVEEDTSKESMEEAFRVLGSIDSTFGTYYVYGNHDKQPYSENKTFTEEELNAAIEENGIHILKDAYVELGDELILAGRDDAAWSNSSGRASSAELLAGVDRDKYIIMLDHQPVDAEENSEQGVDLQMSGHTHGGQIWPVGYLSELTGVLNYGEYQRGDCTVIVSSGVAGWGYSIRTEEQCEYVVVGIGHP